MIKMNFYIAEVFCDPESCYYNFINGIDSHHFIFIYKNKSTIDILFFTEHYKRFIDSIEEVLNLKINNIGWVKNQHHVIPVLKPTIKISYKCDKYQEEIKEMIKKIIIDVIK